MTTFLAVDESTASSSRENQATFDRGTEKDRRLVSPDGVLDAYGVNRLW
jgi:hypothetical protein